MAIRTTNTANWGPQLHAWFTPSEGGAPATWHVKIHTVVIADFTYLEPEKYARMVSEHGAPEQFRVAGLREPCLAVPYEQQLAWAIQHSSHPETAIWRQQKDSKRVARCVQEEGT